jgi:hypothetical protein
MILLTVRSMERPHLLLLLKILLPVSPKPATAFHYQIVNIFLGHQHHLMYEWIPPINNLHISVIILKSYCRCLNLPMFWKIASLEHYINLYTKVKNLVLHESLCRAFLIPGIMPMVRVSMV